MRSKPKTTAVTITRHVIIKGKHVSPGETVQLSPADARLLIGTGKAVPAGGEGRKAESKPKGRKATAEPGA